jgi:hypothetical protein
VGADGRVLGVVFSRSTVDPNVGYALASGAVAGTISSGESKSATVTTGSCAAA